MTATARTELLGGFADVLSTSTTDDLLVEFLVDGRELSIEFAEFPGGRYFNVAQLTGDDDPVRQRLLEYDDLELDETGVKYVTYLAPEHDDLEEYVSTLWALAEVLEASRGDLVGVHRRELNRGVPRLLNALLP